MDNKQIKEIHEMAQIALGKQITMECTKFAIEEGFFDNFIALYNANYQKIDKGSVVISKEEYDTLKKAVNELITEERAREIAKEYFGFVTKQAVKEVLGKIKNKGTIHTEYDWNDYLEIDVDYLKEIAKEFGVDI